VSNKIIRIGGASGYWGDAAMATPQLLECGDLDYLVYDYLAEITMSIMARARAKDSNAGYARDFITSALQQNLSEIARQGVKIIANAGGVNPSACAEAARTLIAEQGLELSVAVVTGDDLISQKDQLSATEMYNGDSFPDPATLASINAYLGAFPIAEALAKGADIVITGRSVDSAVTLGACIFEFGWHAEQWDQLAAGTLAGHLLECGTQATGGNYTDWYEVIDSLDNMGYPIAEISSNGSFDLLKPQGTGGMVSVGTISEQMLYEIGDPKAYIVPDVVCDFSVVELKLVSPDRVNVSQVRGYPATDSYKVSATYNDGWRGGSLVTFYGADSDKKAQGYAEAAFKRSRNVLSSEQLADFSETSIEILGAESQYGDARKIDSSREVVLKLAAKHPQANGISILLKETTGLALAAPPGLSGFVGARAKPSPVVRLFSFLIPKDQLPIQIDCGDGSFDFNPAKTAHFDQTTISTPLPPTPSLIAAKMVEVPLVTLAWGRSGDKGNKANIGIIARCPEYLPYIWETLNEQLVAQRFAHFLKQGSNEKQVQRFLLPGSHAINFLLSDVLGGGGIASLRNDSQGKGYAQILLDQPVLIPEDLLTQETGTKR
jgi:hypothetical protein